MVKNCTDYLVTIIEIDIAKINKFQMLYTNLIFGGALLFLMSCAK